MEQGGSSTAAVFVMLFFMSVIIARIMENVLP